MAIVKGQKPHVMVVPFPAQGHVRSLMKLSRQIAKRGIKVTFVNIEAINEKLLGSASKHCDDEDYALEDNGIVLASIPNGRRSGDNPNDTFLLLESLKESMPGFLADLIEKINSSNASEKISCVIIDLTIEWLSDTVVKMGAEPVAYSPLPAACLTIVSRIQNLMDEGKLDENGNIIKGEIIRISDDMPAWRSNELSWIGPDLETQKIFFNCCEQTGKKLNDIIKLVLVNTCHQLEPAACDLNPNFLPIGPVLDPDSANSISSIHPEDISCLNWLDEKPHGSVVFVSFGSLAVVSQQQLDELALGLELSGRPFLWVVRPDLANGSKVVYPDGFLDRADNLGIGKLVNWAPQEKVLTHPSVACFLSHCGWNSIIEGLINGVRFLCWASFGDQFHNQNYICDKWKNGLRIVPDYNGIRSREEIKTKVKMILSDDNVKANALKLKGLAATSVDEGGSSYKNFEMFIDKYIRK